MDALGKYAAGPLALASLGVALWDVSNAASFFVWALALVWASAALVAWRHERWTLRDRGLRVANRIRSCTPGWWKTPPYRRASNWGDDVTIGLHIAELMEYGSKWRSKIWRPPRRYTPRVHRRLVVVLEEMAAHGQTDHNLKRYVVEMPTPGEYEQLAINLAYRAARLPPDW